MYSWSDPLFGYAWNFEFFVVAFLFGLGLATLGSGLFTAYFGAGKSQQIGFGLIIMAILVLGLQYHQTYIAIPATFDAALNQLGALGVTELSTLIGYYSLLAFNANAFEIDIPEGGTEQRLPI